MSTTSIADASLPSFPLLRHLPSVAENEVFRAMDPIDLLIISQTSRKTKALVKRVFRRYPLHLTITCLPKVDSVAFGFGEKISVLNIEKISDKGTDYEPMSKLRFDNGTVAPFDYNDKGATVYINVKSARLMILAIFDFLTNVFVSRKLSIGFETDVADMIMLITKYCNIKQLNLQKMTVVDHNLNDLIYKFILDNTSGLSELEIFGNPKASYEYQFPNGYSKKNLKIKHVHWLTFENLYSFMNCLKVHICQMSITNQELNQFLKKWLSGEYKLKHLELEVEVDLDLFLVIKGLNAMDFKGTHQSGTCYRIQRKDGVTATVSLVDGRFILKTDQ